MPTQAPPDLGTGAGGLMQIGTTQVVGQSGTPGANLPVDAIQQASNMILQGKADLSRTAGAETRLDGFDGVGGGGGAAGATTAAAGTVAANTANEDTSSTGTGGDATTATKAVDPSTVGSAGTGVDTSADASGTANVANATPAVDTSGPGGQDVRSLDTPVAT